MANYIYSDFVYLSTIMRQLAQTEDTTEYREALIEELTVRANKANRADGVWVLSDQRVRLIYACRAMIDLLSVPIPLAAVQEWLEAELYWDLKTPAPCKVLFLAQEFSVWPSMESVYNAMSADPRFEPQIVYLPFFHPNKPTDHSEVDKYRAMGIPAMRYTEYNVSKEAPDMVICIKPYDGNIPTSFATPELEKVIDRFIYIPYGMELSRKLYRYGYHEYLHYKAWRHIAYGKIVKQVGIEQGYRNGENIAVWGHPKADNYRGDRYYLVPAEWKKKISGRRVLMWCPHHIINPGKEKTSTWVEFSDTVFKTVQKHPEIVLLMRPHPMLFGALVNNGRMTQAEMDEMLENIRKSENIILDDTSDYRTATMISDALITDGTTFAIEYLYTRKPYMVTTTDIESFYEPEKMDEALYMGRTPEDVEAFIEMFAEGKDPKEKARLAYRRETMFIPKNMSVGRNIAINLLTDITKEEEERAAGIIHER